jgi:hypothetical protein
VRKIVDGVPGYPVASARVTRYAYERFDGKYGRISLEGLLERYSLPGKFIRNSKRQLEPMDELPVESYLENDRSAVIEEAHPVMLIPGTNGRLGVGIKYEVGIWAISKEEPDAAVKLGAFLETMLQTTYAILADHQAIPNLKNQGKIVRTYGDELSTRFYSHMLFREMPGLGPVERDGLHWRRLMLNPSLGLAAVAKFAKLKGNMPNQSLREIEATLDQLLRQPEPDQYYGPFAPEDETPAIPNTSSTVLFSNRSLAMTSFSVASVSSAPEMTDWMSLASATRSFESKTPIELPTFSSSTMRVCPIAAILEWSSR